LLLRAFADVPIDSDVPWPIVDGLRLIEECFEPSTTATLEQRLDALYRPDFAAFPETRDHVGAHELTMSNLEIIERRAAEATAVLLLANHFE
jgi:hypothetical protein